MKKILLLAVAALTFAACGNSSSKEEKTVKATELTEAHSCSHCGKCDKDSTATAAADSTKVAADSTAKTK